MPNFLNFNNMSSYGIGYTDNLYGQPSISPTLPNLFNSTSNIGMNPYSLMSSPINSCPITTSSLNDVLRLILTLKQLEMANDYVEPEPEINNQLTQIDYSNSKELKSKWYKYGLSDKFYAKVVNISNKLKCDPNALMAVMKSESSLDSKAVNSSSGATGLIQFMPSTARSLGTSTSELKQMTPEEQLNYVEKYLMKCKRVAGIGDNTPIDGGTLYSLVFLPGYAGKNVLTRSGNAAYEANKGLDLNNDGDIDKNDLNRRVNRMMA